MTAWDSKLIFQSTPPRGWRPKPQTITRLSSWNFNPLHREGGDKVIGMIFKRQAISIHSTARVETFSEPFKVGNPLFQSTPPRGWRLGIANVCRGHRNFNPLHREGGDERRPLRGVSSLYFNPLHREGGDINCLPTHLMLFEFQSTPPRGWRQVRTDIT